MLPIMECFYSLQGEGFNQGKPCFFIRLAGCNIGCSWCDVKESWAVTGAKYYDSNELMQLVKKTPTKNIIITGGEPTLYDLESWVTEFQNENYKVFLETSGAYKITGKFDWVCLSPKKFKPPLASNLSLADELKIIVFNKDDLNWAKKYQNLVKKDCQLYLQPEWSKQKEMTPLIIDFLLEFPDWRISLQVHKFLNIA